MVAVSLDNCTDVSAQSLAHRPFSDDSRAPKEPRIKQLQRQKKTQYQLFQPAQRQSRNHNSKPRVMQSTSGLAQSRENDLYMQNQEQRPLQVHQSQTIFSCSAILRPVQQNGQLSDSTRSLYHGATNQIKNMHKT